VTSIAWSSGRRREDQYIGAKGDDALVEGASTHGWLDRAERVAQHDDPRIRLCFWHLADELVRSDSSPISRFGGGG
jgi:hypothetical protein